MKYILFVIFTCLVSCSDVQKQLDKASDTSRASDSVLKEFNKIDKALSNAKAKIDSALPSRAQEDGLLNLPRKFKRKVDSLIN